MIRLIAFIAFALALQGCSFLHHVQIGDIDNRKGYRLEPFDVKVSETGVSLDDAKSIARHMNSRRANEGLEILALFQIGPRTGNPVYVANYAGDLLSAIEDQCKSGQITGLQAIRESRKYPVISGEIVKVTGYCKKKR